jgi:peroxiredoxin
LKNRTAWLITLLTVLLFISSVTIIILIRQARAIKTHLPYLTPGEKITYFDLTGMHSEVVSRSHLDSAKASLIFVFKQPCSHCNGNILYWNRIARILKGSIDIYGVIPGGPAQMFELADKARLHFKLFVPDDPAQLKKAIRYKLNMAQTILVVDGKVDSVIIGELDGDSFTGVLQKAKQFLKKNKQEEDSDR